jgi:hypothetical protein
MRHRQQPPCKGDPWAAPSVRVIWPDGAQTRLTDGQGGPTATHPADLLFLVTEMMTRAR